MALLIGPALELQAQTEVKVLEGIWKGSLTLRRVYQGLGISRTSSHPVAGYWVGDAFEGVIVNLGNRDRADDPYSSTGKHQRVSFSLADILDGGALSAVHGSSPAPPYNLVPGSLRQSSTTEGLLKSLQFKAQSFGASGLGALLGLGPEVQDGLLVELSVSLTWRESEFGPSS